MIQLTRTTQRAAGGCNACNRNIGPKGFIDPLLLVRLLTVGADESRHTTGLRFCAACWDELVVMVLKGGVKRTPRRHRAGGRGGRDRALSNSL